jgi:ACS family D-galactonate transporter-like MFS transporter
MSLRNRWAIATLTSAGVFVTYMLRFNISPIGQLISTDLHLSDFELGLVLSGSLWIYTLMQPVAGLITDRYGAKLSLLLGGLATSILTIVSGFAGSFFAFLGMRVIIGATQSPNFVTGASVSSSDWFNKNQKARATSIWISGGRFGQVLTLPFAAWLGVAYGWQWAFFVTGLVGIAWCSAWYLGFQNNPPEASQGKEKPAKSLSIRKSLPAVVTPLGLGFALASFGQGYVAYYLNLWLPTYLVRQQKFTILNAGIFSTLPFIALVATLLLVGGVFSDYAV